jgi:Replication-relaxation
MAPRLSPRDLAILRAVGRFRMLTRDQVTRCFLPGISEPTISRLIARLAERGWLGVERMHQNGIQVLWLTQKGSGLLFDHGEPETDLFPATGPAAAKDFAHTVEIGNAAVWLMGKVPRPDELLPAWHLQRLFGGTLAAIPDLLALWRRGDDSPGAALALEIDLGTEPIASVLVPKLVELERTLGSWMPGDLAAILVLVRTARRAESLRRAISDTSMMRTAVATLAAEKR